MTALAPHQATIEQRFRQAMQALDSAVRELEGVRLARTDDQRTIAEQSREIRRLRNELAAAHAQLDECATTITQLRLQCEAYERAGLERIDRRAGGAW